MVINYDSHLSLYDRPQDYTISIQLGLPPVPCTGRTVSITANRRVGQHGNLCRLVEIMSSDGSGRGRTRLFMDRVGTVPVLRNRNSYK